MGRVSTTTAEEQRQFIEVHCLYQQHSIAKFLQMQTSSTTSGQINKAEWMYPSFQSDLPAKSQFSNFIQESNKN